MSLFVCVCDNFNIFLSYCSHSHVYVLEKSQHKVPEEALKVGVCGCVFSSVQITA